MTEIALTPQQQAVTDVIRSGGTIRRRHRRCQRSPPGFPRLAPRTPPFRRRPGALRNSVAVIPLRFEGAAFGAVWTPDGRIAAFGFRDAGSSLWRYHPLNQH
jgi:hypothetical protein